MRVYDMEQGKKCSKWSNQSADHQAHSCVSGSGSIGSNFATTRSTPEDEYIRSKPMRSLRDGIIELATLSKLAHPLSEQKIKEIEDCLRNLFFDSYMNTPDHPPYSEMIFKAIESLNANGKGEGGANKAAISAYIKSEFHDLAWAHETLLSQHLGKLIERGEVLTSPNGNYLLPKPPMVLPHEDLEPKHASPREASSFRGQRKRQGQGKKSRGRPPKKATIQV